MSDTSDERVIGYAEWNESEARSLRLHCADSPSMPELAEMHEETAATLRKLMAERNRLREAAAVVNSVCGKNNCNCPGAKKVRNAIEALEKIARADFNCTTRQMGMAMQGCAEDVLKELVT